VNAPIRFRLTLWYVAVLAVVLVALGAFVVTRLRSDERAMLIDSAPLRDDHEPAGRVGDLPTLEQRRI